MPRLRVADIEYLDLNDLLRIEAGAQVAVDQFESAIRQFGGQQTPREADLLIQREQCLFLCLGMGAGVEFVRHQLAGADTDVAFDAVARWRFHGLAFEMRRYALTTPCVA